MQGKIVNIALGIFLFLAISCTVSVNKAVAQQPTPSIIPKSCSISFSHIELGMKRAEFEKWSHADGGLSVQFKQERYILDDCSPSSGRVIKFDVAFKPAGMSDNEYYLRKWAIPNTQSPNDTLMQVSQPYIDFPFID